MRDIVRGFAMKGECATSSARGGGALDCCNQRGGANSARGGVLDCCNQRGGCGGPLQAKGCAISSAWGVLDCCDHLCGGVAGPLQSKGGARWGCAISSAQGDAGLLQSKRRRAPIKGGGRAISSARGVLDYSNHKVPVRDIVCVGVVLDPCNPPRESKSP